MFKLWLFMKKVNLFLQASFTKILLQLNWEHDHTICSQKCLENSSFVFTIVPCFCFYECGGRAFCKRSCDFWKAVLAFRVYQNTLPSLTISLYLGIEWLKFCGSLRRRVKLRSSFCGDAFPTRLIYKVYLIKRFLVINIGCKIRTIKRKP